MRKPGLRDRLRYEFDNTLSSGPVALIAWLFAVSAAMVVGVSLLVRLARLAPQDDAGARPGLLGQMWLSLLHALDASYIENDQGSLAFMVVMFALTLGGIFIVSILIGILTSGLEGRLEDLRRGRSRVVESGHTVILGWSPQIFSVISELIAASSNKGRSAIAVLADRGKVEMDDEIRSKVPARGRTRVVCRSGNPADLADLQVVSPQAARSVIILAPDGENPDSAVIKTILALVNHPERRKEPYHIVAEIHEPRNQQVAKMVAGDEAQLILVGGLISRITVQSSRQSGLSVIYTELLDFSGDEIYFRTEPRLTGLTFGEATFRYEDSAVIGVRLADGTVLVNPDPETVLAGGDAIIAISRDDDTVVMSETGPPAIDHAAILPPTETDARPTRTLLLGWNAKGYTILRQLDNYVAAGSSVHVVADVDASAVVEAAAARCGNLTITFDRADTTDRTVIDGLSVPTAYDHVIVLSYSELCEPQDADGRTLVTLLHLRDIADRQGHTFSIVSEMLDVRNRDLAEITRADDFIVSDRLVGLMLSQVAEQRDLGAVFAELFDPEGSEIYIKPASSYVLTDRPVNFFTILESARRRRELAIGYRVASEANSAAHRYGIRLNPTKSAEIRFSPRDSIIVLAES